MVEQAQESIVNGSGWNVGLEAAHPEAQAAALAVPGSCAAWCYLGGAAPAFYSHGGYLPVGWGPRRQVLGQGH